MREPLLRFACLLGRDVLGEHLPHRLVPGEPAAHRDTRQGFQHARQQTHVGLPMSGHAPSSRHSLRVLARLRAEDPVQGELQGDVGVPWTGSVTGDRDHAAGCYASDAATTPAPRHGQGFEASRSAFRSARGPLVLSGLLGVSRSRSTTATSEAEPEHSHP